MNDNIRVEANTINAFEKACAKLLDTNIVYTDELMKSINNLIDYEFKNNLHPTVSVLHDDLFVGYYDEYRDNTRLFGLSGCIESHYKDDKKSLERISKILEAMLDKTNKLIKNI